MFDGINLAAVAAAGALAFVAGGLWYSPVLFARQWLQATGLTAAELPAGNPALVYGGSLLLTLLAALVFALFLGPQPAFAFATGAGFSAGLCWVAASFGINYLFEGRPLKLFLINGGYHTLQFTLYGVVLGLWH
jgi:hypothetical protein